MKKLFKLGIVVGIFTGIAKLGAYLKSEYQGLTEPGVRAKLHSKLDGRIPPEKVDNLAGNVVEMMRKQGALGEEEVPAETEEENPAGNSPASSPASSASKRSTCSGVNAAPTPLQVRIRPRHASWVNGTSTV